MNKSVKILVLLVFSILSACTDADESNWDEMKWDEGSWGMLNNNDMIEQFTLDRKHISVTRIHG